jgi:hypothetical protein
VKDDPLISQDWHEDPWDVVDAVPESAIEVLPQELDHLRSPIRMVAIVAIDSVLLLGMASWWVINQLNPSGEQGTAVNFTGNDGDTDASVAER